MKFNAMFMFGGFGPALRKFDKNSFYCWGYSGRSSTIDDFLLTYIGGGEL
jgi:hypothetical protein